MTKPLSVVVAGGGTAGHIEPALAVADALRAQGAQVVALGTSRGLETTLVPSRGYPLELITPVPVPRKPNLDLCKLPFRLLRTIWQTVRVLKKHNCDALIGFGGYVAAPGYIAAALTRTPFLVHEANARAGMANKLGVRLGGVGLNAVPDSGMPGEVVGIPIRSALGGAASEQEQADAVRRAVETWGLDPERPTILVTGGSQGAHSINTAVAEGVQFIVDAGYQVLHSVGAKNVLPPAQPGYVPVSYIDDMAAAYAIADLIVCRAGAMTVAENTAASKVAIYVPLPHGNGEQGLNAQAIIEHGGAISIEDADLDADTLVDAVLGILGNEETLTAMQQAVAAQAGVNVAEIIAQKITHLVATR